MKRLITFLFLSLLTVVMLAQHHVTGKVVENDSQEPVSQTTVKLLKLDSTLVTGVLTDFGGKIQVEGAICW